MLTATDQNVTAQIVSDYLDDLDHLLQHADAESVAVMAPAELARTIGALRAILTDHPSPGTSHGPGPMGRVWRRAWQRVCAGWAWRVAHQHLILAAPADPTGPIDVVGGPR